MTIEERIERLERANRRYRLMFTLLGALAVCAVGISATQDHDVPDLIQAKAFEVVDDEWNVLVRLRDLGGKGGLATYANTGDILVGMTAGVTVDGKRAGFVSTFCERKTLVRLAVNTSGKGVVETLNGNGKTLVRLGASFDGVGMVTTLNGNGEPLVELGATVDGGGTVSTLNGKGKTFVKLGVSVDGPGGSVTTWNDQGKKLVAIGWDREGDGGTLSVYNKSGESVCTLTVDEYGNGVIGAWNRNGKGRTLKPGP